MAAQRLADMTVEELKTLIAEVVAQQLNCWLQAANPDAIASGSSYGLPKRTEAEQREIDRALIEWYRDWAEQGDEQEQPETLEYLQTVLEEDHLSNRPRF